MPYSRYIRVIGKVVLVAALSFFVLDASAQTKKLGFEGRPTTLHERNLADYVDFDEIHNNLGERKVTVSVGDFSFAGRLHDDGMKVSQDRIDEIVRKTFNEMDLSGGELQRIEQDLANAALGSNVDWNGLLGDLVTALGTSMPIVSIGNDLYNLSNGDQGTLQTIFNIGATAAMGAAAVSAAPYVALTAAVCGGAMTAATFASMAMNHSGNYSAALDYFNNLLSGDPVGQRTMEGAAKRYDFYRRINARIAAEAMKNAKGWVLDIDDCDDSPKSFFGVAITQMAHMTAHMKMKTHLVSDAVINWQGSYSGTMKLVFTHKLDRFDSNFKSEVLMRSQLPFFRSTVLEFPGEAQGEKSELYKELSDNNFEFDFRSSDGTIKAGMKRRAGLDGFRDKSYFNCMKDITGKLNYANWNGGNLTGIAGLSGESQINLGFMGKMVDNRCSAALKIVSQQDFSNLTTALGYSSHSNLATINLDGEFLYVDRQIFSDLRNGMFIEVEEREVNWL